jgi:hypothetical protein
MEVALMKINSRKPRGFEALAPTAQLFHGLGKGLGRGRGPRLAKVPVPEEQPLETREKTEVPHGTPVTV